MITKQVLFGPDQDHGLSYRIPVLHIAESGAQFAFCEAREGRGGDWDPMWLQMRRRAPGQGWTPPVSLAHNGRGPVHNPVPFEADGRLHLLYGMDYARYFQVASSDGGNSFSPPQDITYVFEAFRDRVNWRCIAAGPGGACRLEGGRIVVPVWLGGLADPGRHQPAQVATIFSDDNGRTWRAGEVIDFFSAGPSEAQIAPVPGGARIVLRNGDPRRRRAFAFSPDGAAWEKPVFDLHTVEVNCQCSLLRAGDALITSGPEPQGLEEAGMRARINLLLRISRDFGRTWRAGFALEPGIAGYSALAYTREDALLCLYETWEDYDRMRLVLATMRLEDIAV